MVDYGKTYLLRIINAALQDILFLAVKSHPLIVVATDASYTKPFQTDYIAISPGQTIDVLLKADCPQGGTYYMAASAYSSSTGVTFDNTTTTALIKYTSPSGHHTAPSLPSLPPYNDTVASVNFTGKMRSLNTVSVPAHVSHPLFFTLSVNTLPCANDSCAGPNGTRLSASVNNISWDSPNTDILSAYYDKIKDVYGVHFPRKPVYRFNYTAESLSAELQTPKVATEVKVLEYNSTVEIVFQGTTLVGGSDHPMHIHGTSFFVVGWGFGNFDKKKDPLNYNLVDPPLHNTIAVPKNGWSAIRFIAKNPGVWFMHCHLERHLNWGMEMTFIIKNGNTPESQMLPPPLHRPPC